MSVRALKKSIADKRRKKDQFDVGEVIRWSVLSTRAGAPREYSYAAIKTPSAWFTTAREGNPFVPQSLVYDDLVKILTEDRVIRIDVPTTWESVFEVPVAEDPVGMASLLASMGVPSGTYAGD